MMLHNRLAPIAAAKKTPHRVYKFMLGSGRIEYSGIIGFRFAAHYSHRAGHTGKPFARGREYLFGYEITIVPHIPAIIRTSHDIRLHRLETGGKKTLQPKS